MSCPECGKTEIHWCDAVLRDATGVPCCDDKDLRNAGRDGRDVTVWQCRFCFYWEKQTGITKHVGEIGVCRFNPPQIHAMAGYITQGVWPTTQEDEWCGKFTEDAPHD